MILLYFILYTILFIAGLLLLFKVIKSVLKIVMIGILIIMISIGLFGFLLFSDAKDFSENFGKEPKLFIVVDNDKIIFATEMLDMSKQITKADSKTESNGSEQYNFLDKAAVDLLNSNYAAGDMKKVQGNYFKVFIVKLSAIEKALPEIIELPKEVTEKMEEESSIPSGMQKPKLPQTLTKAEVISLIRSDSPQNILIDMMLKDVSGPQTELFRTELMKSPDLTSEKVKGMAFMIAIDSIIKQQGFKVLFTDFQKGDIDIYPESFVFKVAKGIPYGMLKSFVPVNESAIASENNESESE
jgi:hypothetical protein